MLGAPSPRSLIGLPISAIIHPDGRAAGAQRRTLLFSRAQPFSRIKVKLIGLTDKEITTMVLARRFDVGQESFALVVGLDTMSECTEVPYGWQREMPTFPSGMPLSAAVLDALPQPIGAFDKTDNIIFMNDAGIRVFGDGHGAEIIDKPLARLIHPVVRDAVSERHRMVLEHGQSFLNVAAKALTLSGSELRTTGSIGRATLPLGEHIGYWMSHSVEPVRAETVTP